MSEEEAGGRGRKDGPDQDRPGSSSSRRRRSLEGPRALPSSNVSAAFSGGNLGQTRAGHPRGRQGVQGVPSGKDGEGGAGVGERWGGRKGRERGLLFLGGPDSCVAAGAAAVAPEESLGKLVLGRGGGCSGLREKTSPCARLCSRLQQRPEYFNGPFLLLF